MMSSDEVVKALAIIGPIAGAFGWYVTVRLNRAASRSKHTFDVLLATAFNASYQEHLSVVRPHMVNAGNDAFPELHRSKNHKLHDSVLFLLNYYEFLAGAVRHGVLAEDLLHEDQGYIVRQLFIRSKEFIADERTRKKRPALFDQFEWLYNRWNKNKIGRLQKIWEWILTRPAYGKE
jgi:hypothetical protein